MRDIMEILDNVVGVLPDKESGFKEMLLTLKVNCSYTAPEAMQERWMEFGSYINRFIPYPSTEDWHKAVIKHFTGEEYAV